MDVPTSGDTTIHSALCPTPEAAPVKVWEVENCSLRVVSVTEMSQVAPCTWRRVTVMLSPGATATFGIGTDASGSTSHHASRRMSGANQSPATAGRPW